MLKNLFIISYFFTSSLGVMLVLAFILRIIATVCVCLHCKKNLTKDEEFSAKPIFWGLFVFLIPIISSIAYLICFKTKNKTYEQDNQNINATNNYIDIYENNNPNYIKPKAVIIVLIIEVILYILLYFSALKFVSNIHKLNEIYNNDFIDDYYNDFYYDDYYDYYDDKYYDDYYDDRYDDKYHNDYYDDRYDDKYYDDYYDYYDDKYYKEGSNPANMTENAKNI